ncbi:MAG: twin-arginine translocation signal domain-containing protein [Terriglobia bacterium]
MGALLDASRLLSLRRRDFLRGVCGAGAAAACGGVSAAAPSKSKVVIVTFGGGARDDETFALRGQRNIPHILNELIPQGTFFTRVVNRGILGHYVATAGIATGRYETFNNFVSQPPPAPTLFEYYRKHAGTPTSDCWVVAPSNGFERIGASSARQYGPAYGAGVVLPKNLLSSAVSGQTAAGLRDFEHLLQDSYEMPIPGTAASALNHDFNLTQLTSALKLSVDDFLRNARALSSPDELSVHVARQLMRAMAPSLLFVTLHDMDVAHVGTYSLYLEGIQRSDRLCAVLWQAIQSDPEYKDRTTMLILPDFGRDADGDPGGNGFQHHRTGGPLARTTWLLALGPHVRGNVTVDRLVECIDVVPTVGGLLGFDTPMAQGSRIAELL